MAGQQSKLSHETAKGYYERHTKLEQFNKSDFVCVHDHTHRRSKTRKFLFQYRRPFEFEQNSPLICTVSMADANSGQL